MAKLALVSLSLLLVCGLQSRALASHQCGCAAKCSDGFIYHDIEKKCVDTHNACRVHSDDNDCAIVCVKKSDATSKETVKGTCYDVYFRAISLKPRH